jgi:hypothetical protein
MRVRNTFFLFALGLILSAARAPAQSGYSYTTIDYPASFTSGVFGINKAGQMSGTYFGNDAVAHAFICTKGEFNRLDFPGAARTFGFSLNEAAWIVGHFSDTDNQIHGFLYDTKKFTALDYPKAKATRAYGLNQSGQIVGSYVDEQNVTHGFLHQAGKFTTVDFPGSTRTDAYGINDAGVVVGSYSDSKSVTHGFQGKPGALTSYDFPGANNTTLYGVTDSGQIVGSFSDEHKNHGLIKEGNVSLHYPGSHSTFGFAIDDSLQVVGQYVDDDSVAHGFLAVKGKEQGPQISQRLDPDNIRSGVGAFKLTVRGIGFVQGSVLLWNGTPRKTMFQDRSHLIANVEAADVAEPNVASLMVVNPGPNGASSNVVAFVVHKE